MLGLIVTLLILVVETSGYAEPSDSPVGNERNEDRSWTSYDGAEAC
jgi:hypothetical protein